ncbi:unnamed protein product [Arabidopsis thaliana]|uniref:Uncharacterized protein n=1 Tax=Arabidopsis thaliana TaxID=3702 RepID=Q9LK06_ARATH|nr:unnamed protein product [Arabidopsis thaliana]
MWTFTKTYTTTYTATLACAILYICAGNAHMGGVYLRLFGSNHYALESEDARDICEEVLKDIKKYGNTLKYTYANSFSFPECVDVSTPECAEVCYIRSRLFNNLCNQLNALTPNIALYMKPYCSTYMPYKQTSTQPSVRERNEYFVDVHGAIMRGTQEFV